MRHIRITILSAEVSAILFVDRGFGTTLLAKVLAPLFVGRGFGALSCWPSFSALSLVGRGFGALSCWPRFRQLRSVVESSTIHTPFYPSSITSPSIPVRFLADPRLITIVVGFLGLWVLVAKS
ncbi:hypothetical protein K435DRAFT_848491 [Dendrothele bispora CBS 962.96]|uniref:Uncharacterized protein n=1 Tax=Dendrothele bispora (strain CBS 962.96) TaxID=1314807 RepID=A0A4S8MWP5_DENBC|nr:hypothetical protein K435DRAFT_848491 [Dendrothele bispora CBS 962.96]